MGISGGLSRAPMFAAAGTLAPDRATTGRAVLNMSRQVGNALTAAHDPVTGYDHAWEVQIGAGLAAATVLLAFGRARSSSARAARV
jgi:hypothetical protein